MRAAALAGIGRALSDERRQVRSPILLRGRIGSSQFGKRVVVLTDISTRGCRVSTPFQWESGTRLVLTVPSLAPIAVTVRWTTNEAAGLALDAPLHPLVLDHVIAMARALAPPEN